MSRKLPSKDDIDLFQKTVGKVTPVITDRVAPVQRQRKPYPRSRQKDDAQVIQDMLSDFEPDANLETGEELLHVRPGLQHSVFKKLRRGKYSVGAELDLHGMTVPVARQALSSFLHDCGDRRIRCVRIVHGKGKGSRNSLPILKNKVNQWLRQWDSVLAFCTAQPADGGTGAIYVLLKHLR